MSAVPGGTEKPRGWLFSTVAALQFILPEVEIPRRQIQFKEKCLWTIITLLIFLVCCQIPLYGIRPTEASDPHYWLRVLVASNRGSLMELGITPIVTVGMVMQVMTASQLISMDRYNHQERKLMDSATKLCAILMTLTEAVIYVYNGSYGAIQDIGYGNAVLIIIQLFTAGLVVILLDEVLQKGYGLGSGISLFMATNICENVIWKTFSPTTLNTGRGTEFEGAVIAMFHMLLTWKDKTKAIGEAFYRTNLPNISNLLATIVVFAVVIYFQGFRVELPIQHKHLRGQRSSYPIRLLYCSNFPIILQTCFVSNIYLFSQSLWMRFGNNFIVNLLGKWDRHKLGGYYPTGGLAYYVSPPRTVADITDDPFHFLFYLTFVLTSCALFSLYWTSMSGSSPKDVAKMFKNSNMVIKGCREDQTIKVLNRYIPVAAASGGMCIGALTVFADFMGAIGSGTGILLAVTIIFQYYEIYSKERAQDSGEMFAINY